MQRQGVSVFDYARLLLNFMSKNIYKKTQGFSLIETLIAVSILMIAITGPFALVQAGLMSSYHQRNQVTATYLAQEALEFIKSIRDTNSYTQYDATPKDWLASPDGLGNQSLLTLCPATSPTSGCYVDPHQTLPGLTYVQTVPSGGLHYYMHLSTIGVGFEYDYNTAYAETSFERIVSIKPIDLLTNHQEVEVTVTVNWRDGQLPRTYAISTHMFDYEVGDTSGGGGIAGPQTADGTSGSTLIGYMYSGAPKCQYSDPNDLNKYGPPCTSTGADFSEVAVNGWYDVPQNPGGFYCGAALPIYNTTGTIQSFYSDAQIAQQNALSGTPNCGMSYVYLFPSAAGYKVTLQPNNGSNYVLSSPGPYNFLGDYPLSDNVETGVVVTAN